MEVICKLIELKRFVNRGFLIGPICPIYGYGVLGILFLIGPDTKDFLGVFLKSILLSSGQFWLNIGRMGICRRKSTPFVKNICGKKFKNLIKNVK